jgi:hypothetical protein
MARGSRSRPSRTDRDNGREVAASPPGGFWVWGAAPERTRCRVAGMELASPSLTSDAAGGIFIGSPRGRHGGIDPDLGLRPHPLRPAGDFHRSPSRLNQGFRSVEDRSPSKPWKAESILVVSDRTPKFRPDPSTGFGHAGGREHPLNLVDRALGISEPTGLGKPITLGARSSVPGS